MSVSMTANYWWTSFYNCEMWLVIHRMYILVVASTSDTCPVCFLFALLVKCLCALVLLDCGVSSRFVLDPLLFAGAVVLIAGFVLGVYFFFLVLCLATLDCSTIRTTGVDTVENCWVGCVIDLV